MLYSEKHDWKKKQAQCGHKNDSKPVCFSSITKILEENLNFNYTGPDWNYTKTILFLSIKFSFSVFVMI